MQERHIEVAGESFCVFEGGDPDAQPLLLVHATGFHARVWDQIIQRLGGDFRVIAPDLRGHGRSTRQGPFTWSQFSDDLLALAEPLGVEQAIGVGHSLGGHCIARSGAINPRLYSHLLLIDPVIFDPALYQPDADLSARFQIARIDDHPIARRRNHFADWQAMREHFAGRSPYSLWQSQMLADYCRYGVLPRDDGDGVELACPPRIEASVYMNNRESDLYAMLPSITQPVKIMRAKPADQDSTIMDFTASPTWPGLAGEFANATDIYCPELTHFIPMQAPEMVAKQITDWD